MRAISHAKKFEFDEAMKDFDKALELYPNRAILYSGRGQVYAQTEQYQKALADLERAVELDPQGYMFAADLAEYLAACPQDDLRDTKKASDLIEQALALAPNQPSLSDNAAAVAAAKGNFDEAISLEKRFLASKIADKSNREDGERRLKLYQNQQPYRFVPTRLQNSPATPSATPAQPEK